MKKTDNKRIIQNPTSKVPYYMSCFIGRVEHPDAKSLRNQIKNLIRKILEIDQRQETAQLTQLRKHVNSVRDKSKF